MKKNYRFKLFIIFALLVVSLFCTMTVLAEQKTGWQEINGYKVYYKSDGKLMKGLHSIDGKYYYFNRKGYMQTGWQTAGGELRFFLPTGEMAIGLTDTGDGIYYFSGKGLKKTGLYTIQGDKYYFDPDTGKAVSKKLVTIDGYKYYFDKNCHAITGWKTIDSKRYYFSTKSCKSYMDSLLQIDGAYYGFGKSGAALTGWHTFDGSRYYFSEKSYKAYISSIRKIGSYYFGFNDKAQRVDGGWMTVGEEKYYINPKSHHAYANVIRTIDGAKYGFLKNGKLAKGWQTVEGKKRYFDDNGKLVEQGFVLIDKKPYILKNGNTTRITKTGIYNGKYVIVKSNGEAVTGKGWTKVNGYKYYFESDGIAIRMDTYSLVRGSKMILKVNKSKCMVNVLAYDSATKSFCKVVKCFVCSPGQPTPLGKHYLGSKHRWVSLVGPTWGQWGCRYDGTKFFHSVYYDEEDNNNTLNVRAYNMLGTICSHGCIRLEAVNAKWVYEHRVQFKYVEIYQSSNPGPFGKLHAVKLPSWHTWDPTDPNMHYKCVQRGCHK